MKIFDTSSVICILKEIDNVKILDQCLLNNYKISITEDVHCELQKEAETYNRFKKYGKFEVLNNVSKECCNKLQNRYPMLHIGEISVLCHSIEVNNQGVKNHCIIDENEARKLQDILPVTITGTIGLIKWHKKNGRLSQEECIEIHRRISDSGFRIAPKILNELLQ